jgi:hypothetical protein
MTNYKDLRCIKHTLESSIGVFTQYITFNQYQTSFIKERWEGETRHNLKETLFGTCHTKAIIDTPSMYSVHNFTFPSSMEEAKALHQQNTKS